MKKSVFVFLAILLVLGSAVVALPSQPCLAEDWSEMEADVVNDLVAVWGSDHDDLFAVGQSGAIFHYDGEGWDEMTVDILRDDLFGVWGSDHDDVFVVGEDGTIIHYDGEDWDKMPVDILEDDLFGVWGSDYDDVLDVGEDGTIIHYDGEDWY
ncbi:MAG: hypothetical protein WBC55_04960, partial [Dehalococcoidia bacterium]